MAQTEAPPPGVSSSAANAAAPAAAPAVPGADSGAGTGDLPRLGTLKSYSPAQGYGFIACDEIRQEHQRDVYLDKSQVGSTISWCPGMTVEFYVVFNSGGLPQARVIDWDPVPHLLSNTAEAHAENGTARRDRDRVHSSQTLASLKDLMTTIANNQRSSAVVKAIELQGKVTPPPGNSDTNNNNGTNGVADRDVDYVAFTLDRLGEAKASAMALKDLVKMLLLLMISKLLKRRMLKERRNKYIGWFEVLVDTINPKADGVPQHFRDVVAQIDGHIRSLNDLNDRDDLRITQLADAVARLSMKAANI